AQPDDAGLRAVRAVAEEAGALGQVGQRAHRLAAQRTLLAAQRLVVVGGPVRVRCRLFRASLTHRDLAIGTAATAKAWSCALYIGCSSSCDCWARLITSCSAASSSSGSVAVTTTNARTDSMPSPLSSASSRRSRCVFV